MNAGILIRSVLILIFLMPSFSAYAAGGASGDRLISYIEVMSNGGVIIQTDTTFNNPDVCALSHRIVILPDNPHLNRYYAAALTAYSTGSYIWAWLEGCWDSPWGAQFPIVRNVATRSAQ